MLPAGICVLEAEAQMVNSVGHKAGDKTHPLVVLHDSPSVVSRHLLLPLPLDERGVIGMVSESSIYLIFCTANWEGGEYELD